MSILNSIQEAEANSVALKAEATEEVRILLEKNKVEIEKKVASLYNTAEDNMRQMNANTDIVVSNTEKKINDANLEAIKALQTLAYSAMDKVVDDVVKKVMQI